jgi:uncharacterized protein (DUF58 family)
VRPFVPFVLGLLVMAVVLRMQLLFSVVYFLAGLYVLSRLWVRHVSDRVLLDRRHADRAFTGDQIDVVVGARNSSRLPVPWLQIRESVPLDLETTPVAQRVYALGSRERFSFTYRLTCRRRGHYLLGPMYLMIGDLLGIEQRELIWGEQDRILVYPKILPLERLGLHALSAQAVLPATSPLVEDPARVIGVRGYRPGDSPRRIHWTATARSGALVVKQYEPAIARDTMIFLDLNGDDYDRRQRHDATELAIVVAASLVHHVIVRESLPAGLATRAADPLLDGATTDIVLPPGSERAQLLAVLEILARVQMTAGADFADAIRRESVRLPWGASVVAISGSTSEHLLATLLYLRRGGFAVSLVLVQPEGSPAVSTELARVPTHIVRRERDVEGWR